MTEWSLHPKIVTRIFKTWGLHQSPQHSSSPVHVFDSGISGTGDRCPVTKLASAVNVYVSTISLAEQINSKLRATQDGEIILKAPWWPSHAVYTLAYLTVYGPPLSHSIPSRSAVTTRVYLRREVVPSAHM